MPLRPVPFPLLEAPFVACVMMYWVFIGANRSFCRCLRCTLQNTYIRSSITSFQQCLHRRRGIPTTFMPRDWIAATAAAAGPGASNGLGIMGALKAAAVGADAPPEASEDAISTLRQAEENVRSRDILETLTIKSRLFIKFYSCLEFSFLFVIVVACCDLCSVYLDSVTVSQGRHELRSGTVLS